MSLDAAKQALKDGYELAGFDVVDESDAGETLLRYPDRSTYDISLRISKEDVEQYAEFLSAKDQFHSHPAGCSLISLNYREHLLEPLTADINETDLRDFQFRHPQDQEPSIRIDTISYPFVSFFRFAHGYMQLCLDRLYFMPDSHRRASKHRPLDIRHILARPVSIRVYDLEAATIAEAIEQSDHRIYDSLFRLAQHYNLPAWTATDWQPPRRTYLKKREERLQQRQTQGADGYLPYEPLPAHLVRLYQSGISSPVPSHRFIAFYQILEFAYESPTVGLYERMANLINAADFDTSPAGLQQLLNQIDLHREYTGAEGHLEQVLAYHIGAGKIARFLAEQQSPLASDTLAEHSHRIKALRDAILLAGDGTTFPAADLSIQRELPLMRFLAESLIESLSETEN